MTDSWVVFVNAGTSSAVRLSPSASSLPLDHMRGYAPLLLCTPRDPPPAGSYGNFWDFTICFRFSRIPPRQFYLPHRIYSRIFHFLPLTPMLGLGNISVPYMLLFLPSLARLESAASKFIFQIFILICP